MSITLSLEQDKVVKSVKQWFDDPFKQVFYLGGLAGTGKSTLIGPIVDMLGLNLEQIAIVAPTAMAAKVVRKKLAAWGIPTGTSTIHKAIYQPRLTKPEVIEMDLARAKMQLIANPANTFVENRVKLLETNLERAYDINDIKFRLNPDSTIVNVKLIIVDESSMVGTEIAEDLKSFDIPVLAIGDPGQLKPIGDTPGLCIGAPDGLLTEIHRQAQDNPIILYSHLVRAGKSMDYGDYGALKIIRARDDHYTCAPDREAQIIVGMNRTRWEITSVLRRMRGIESSAPQEGEPLIVRKNSREHPDLVNGTFLTSTRNHADLEPGRAQVMISTKDEDGRPYQLNSYQGLFEEHLHREKNFSTASKKDAFKARMKIHQLDFGWVMTCHAAQGSQWRSVIVHDESRVFKEDAANWMYTAATRAEDELIVVR
jgi:exodeoxyribonuclease-5